MPDFAEFGATLDALLVPQPWTIDELRHEDGVIEISGWALPPEGRAEDVTFTVDGEPFQEIEYPLPREDLTDIFWYREGVASTGFRCRTSADPADSADGFLTFRYTDRRTGEAFRADQTYYYPDENGAPPVPGAARRKRVAGSEDEGSFIAVGYTTHRRIDEVLQSRFGRGLRDFDAVLDWGCGCGRLARYLSVLAHEKGPGWLTGVDIDADNIGWCQENLPAGTFRSVPLHPPTDLPRAGFDLVIGISVFSHLREQAQVEWLYELSRVTRPGGILLVSVLGETAICRARFHAPQVEQVLRAGHIAIEENTDLAGLTDDESYYVNTYIAPDYLRRSWSRFFDVREIIPATIGNLQDLVILEAK